MYLTANEVAGDPLTHLLKSGCATRTDVSKQYGKFSKQIPSHWRGLKIKYDVWYDMDHLDEKTNRTFLPSFLYTDMLNKCLYFRVPNNRLNTELFRTILLNSHERVNNFVVHRITESLADKYNLLCSPDTEYYDRVVFLPGTNILENILDFDRVKKLVEHEGAKVKPHPLTTKFHQFILKKHFGENNVLNNNVSGFSYLLNAKVAFCCKNSEMGIGALLLKKAMCLVDKDSYSGPKTYGSLYDAILRSDVYSASDALNRIISSEYSGIMHLDDPDAVQKMYNFFNSYNLLYKRP